VDGALITPDYMFYFNDDLQPPPGPAGYTTWWHEGACAVTESYQGFGNFDFAQALAYSDNVVFAQIGQALGPFRFRDYAEQFGLGQTYEIGIEVAPSSLVRDPAYLETSCGLAQTAFGQGQLFVTPLQIGLIGATIANEGELPYPQLVTKPTIGEKGWRVISREAADQVTEMMVTVTEDEFGSGINARIDGVEVAGKTGTAQVSGAPHAWFIGFAPAEDPQYLAVVILEHQGEGSIRAAPLVRDMLYNALSAVEQP
jgi:peptidoglycan glycosyltransferase